MSILDLGHGVHGDVLEGTYHQRILGLASKHALDLVRRSPAHYRAWVDGADGRDSDALRFGRAFDCALLEPDRFALDYVIEPSFGDCRKKENKASREMWREANKGAVWMSSEDHQRAVAMAKSIRSHSRASKLLDGVRAQVTVRWRDAETGLECKARLDGYREELGLVIDVKTAENASEPAWIKAAATYGYHRQNAFYVDGLRAIGAPVEHFVFIVVEKEPPYAVAPYVLDAPAVAKGRSTIREDLITLAERIELDVWNAYPEEIRVLSLPAWAA